MEKTDRIGALALSTAGRDRGRPFLIVGMTDDGTALIADGKLRKVGNPKKKKLKHLTILSASSEERRQKILAGQATDAFVRRTLEAPDGPAMTGFENF